MVMTSKAKNKVWSKYFDLVTVHEHQMMADWCYTNLYHGGHYETIEPNWWVKGNTFYFKDEREYAWFLLRWT